MLPTARHRAPARRRLLLVSLATAAAVATAGSTTAATAAPTAASPAPVTAPATALPPLPVPVPKTVVLDGATIAATRARLAAGGSARLKSELAVLTASADAELTQGPWSVMDKKQTPPSGSKHDYLSEAPYWWPTEPVTDANPWGCPYVDKDGDVNPAVDGISDHLERGEMFTAVYNLALAWYYTGNAGYARRAELDVRTWFTDPATAMNPDLNYAQFIPCSTAVRGEGGIDFSQQFTDVIDATAILDAGAPGWTGADHTAMNSWYGRFLSWNRTSPDGRAEFAQPNNHGSFAAMEDAALALATGQQSTARGLVQGVETRLLPGQLAADGSEPLEITRTRSWHYSNFNLTALTRLAQIGQKVGVDLWSCTTPAGGSLVGSIDYLVPAATGAAAWPYPELDFQAFAADDNIHAAAVAGDAGASAALAKLTPPPGGDLWALEPAPEQLDPVVTG